MQQDRSQKELRVCFGVRYMGSNPRFTIFAKNSQTKSKLLSNLTSKELVSQNHSFTEDVFYQQ